MYQRFGRRGLASSGQRMWPNVHGCAFLVQLGWQLSFHCWHYPGVEVAGPYVICMTNPIDESNYVICNCSLYGQSLARFETFTNMPFIYIWIGNLTESNESCLERKIHIWDRAFENWFWLCLFASWKYRFSFLQTRKKNNVEHIRELVYF